MLTDKKKFKKNLIGYYAYFWDDSEGIDHWKIYSNVVTMMIDDQFRTFFSSPTMHLLIYRDV